mmetsp:Transcript_29085/g.30216  ORF Transcript_29085/g.30216 Transcript_29085/m.30216 type:complete len:186 (-) Transcript_29085:103-660(-)
MPSYHSILGDNYYNKACDLTLIPFNTGKKPLLDYKLIKAKDSKVDILDEALTYFRANVLFKNFPIKSDGDKIIVYTSVFLSKCLSVVADVYSDPKKSKELLTNLITECEWSPSLKSHFLNSIITLNQNEVVTLQKYLKSVREETVSRLYYILFESPGSELDLKYWVGYSKKSFLGFEMPQYKKNI